MGVLDDLVAPSLTFDICLDQTEKIGPMKELAHKLDIVEGVGLGVVWTEGEQRKDLKSHLPRAGLLYQDIV